MTAYTMEQACILHHWIVRQCSKYKHDVQFQWMWETPLKQTHRLNAVIYDSETTESCEEVQNKIIKSQSKPYPAKQNL